MRNNLRLMSSALTLAIIISTIFIIHRFIPSIVWAAIITISTYPLYNRWQKLFGENKNIAAFSFTAILTIIFMLPISLLITSLIQELQHFISYLINLNNHGASAPEWLSKSPWHKQAMVNYWDQSIGQTDGIKKLLSGVHISLNSASYYVKKVGISVVHRSVQLGFTILTLFFFYRDGKILVSQIEKVGRFCFRDRWERFSRRLPQSLESTVNGTIIVGFGVGLLMGISYYFVDLPAPVLSGFVTAVAAMIPFVVPIVFLVLGVILITKGLIINCIIMWVWGMLVMFIADHFVRPYLIGGAIKLPFLAVLFGILGGVETLGLLGLFVGPIILVLFCYTLARGSVDRITAKNRLKPTV